MRRQSGSDLRGESCYPRSNAAAAALLAGNPCFQNNGDEAVWDQDDFAEALFCAQGERGAVDVIRNSLFRVHGNRIDSDNPEESDGAEEASVNSELAAELHYIKDLDNYYSHGCI